MPQKAKATPSSRAHADADPDLLLLINLIVTATDFKPDMKKLATTCGIKDGKNMPRKINAVVEPCGFKFVQGKIVDGTGSKNSSATGDGKKDGEETSGGKNETKKSTKNKKGSMDSGDETDEGAPKKKKVKQAVKAAAEATEE